jgi:hypothetical protein
MITTVVVTIHLTGLDRKRRIAVAADEVLAGIKVVDLF